MKIGNMWAKYAQAPWMTKARIFVTPVAIGFATLEAGMFTSAALVLLWFGAEAADWKQ